MLRGKKSILSSTYLRRGIARHWTTYLRCLKGTQSDDFHPTHFRRGRLFSEIVFSRLLLPDGDPPRTDTDFTGSEMLRGKGDFVFGTLIWRELDNAFVRLKRSDSRYCCLYDGRDVLECSMNCYCVVVV